MSRPNDHSERPDLTNGGRDGDAVFIGWQATRSAGALALYNITAADHPSFGSTVTENGLHKLNLQVPVTPTPKGPEKEF